ncbi:Putative CID domain, SWAP/Surp superfamily protein [Septoria linicola]|uniref:CID domain, SWAP/Surp superfamily protein n=1 Tax=Septoria linicola TaxID=215465 RepID=A0A9Q9AU34_9PEZI|nr:putative CID domain, SWAP/Surp superfamily protein [Septoria linicola]USW55160.1 Putative CID domain, SWAP/Surp superfamily protein [Septoria linicola]
MDDEDAPKEFPDVSQKLAAPKKLSAFEKERLAAEEKRRREQAETAAALAEFEDSFGGNEDFDGFPASARGPPAGPSRGYGGAPRGGFSGGGHSRSGPGSLGPAAGMPPSMKRKRALDELREQQEVRREQEALAAEYSLGSNASDEASTRHVDEEEDLQAAAPRPTVQLSNLQPSTTDNDVRGILRDHLKVHSVSISPPIRQGKLSVTAIAMLDYETSTSQIDTAVSALRDKYLGCGYRLTIGRHLSSTALQPGALPGTGLEPEPFGAEKINRDQPRGHSMRHAPPPGEFAPPDSYDVRPPRNGVVEAHAHIPITPPLDIATVRAIHVIAERLLSEPDPHKALELEAVLMAMPEVEDDERFAFLYNAQSPEGRYYRYLLWSDDEHFDALQEQRRGGRDPERLIDDVPIDWNVAQGEVPFMDLTKLGNVLEHFNYESSDDESDDGVEQRKFNNSRREGEGGAAGDKKHLSPLQIAKFTWLLSRMPATHARLRLSDVASITTFAINNAGAGAEEIVDMLVLNLEKPFGSTQCGRFHEEDPRQDEEDEYEPDVELPSIEPNLNDTNGKEKREHGTDPSQIKLVALYLINDILHNSSTAGVRNAWKYRQLFEAAFRRQETFKTLGRLGKDMGWGRMKDQQWRNKVGVLFEIWERNSVFAVDVFEALKKDFFEQPTDTMEENGDPEERRKTSVLDSKHLAKFKRIDGTASPATAASASPAPAGSLVADEIAVDNEHVPADDTPADELNGDDVDDLDGAALDDLDGAPLDDFDGAALEEPGAVEATGSSAATSEAPPTIPPTAPVKASGAGFSLKSSSESKPVPAEPARRKQAEDMFADSDED